MNYLQDLLHKLKYDHLKGVGWRIGTEAGRLLSESKLLEQNSLTQNNALLVPVPLHSKRYRRRGYNQARVLAEGISRRCNLEVAEEGVVVRRKNTTSQTGLNSRERIKNTSDAFQINQETKIFGRNCIIVDDVYTTGATTFELAGVLSKSNGKKTAIVTIART